MEVRAGEESCDCSLTFSDMRRRPSRAEEQKQRQRWRGDTGLLPGKNAAPPGF